MKTLSLKEIVDTAVGEFYLNMTSKAAATLQINTSPSNGDMVFSFSNRYASEQGTILGTYELQTDAKKQADYQTFLAEHIKKYENGLSDSGICFTKIPTKLKKGVAVTYELVLKQYSRDEFAQIFTTLNIKNIPKMSEVYRKKENYTPADMVRIIEDCMINNSPVEFVLMNLNRYEKNRR